MLTRKEWSDTAERAAASRWGHQRMRWYVARRQAPAAGVLVGVAALGLGAWWVWRHLAAALRATSTDTLPGAIAHGGSLPLLVVLVVAGLVGTVVAFRPGRGVDHLGVLALKVLAVGVFWLGLIAFAVGSLVG